MSIPAFEALTGYSAAELIGRNLRLLQADDREQDGRHRLRDALSRGETCRVLLRNYRKDGSAVLERNDGTAAAPRGRLRHAFCRAITATPASACASIRKLAQGLA